MVILQRGGELGGEGIFDQQAWPVQVVITTGNRAGAGAETLGKLLNHRVVGDVSGALLVGRFAQRRKIGLAVSEYQQVAVFRMLVMPGNTVFGTQALQEGIIAFAVLSAVLAHRTGADIKGKCVSLNTVALQDFCDDLRHAVVLENSLVVAELQIVECGDQGQVIVGQALA